MNLPVLAHCFGSANEKGIPFNIAKESRHLFDILRDSEVCGIVYASHSIIPWLSPVYDKTLRHLSSKFFRVLFESKAHRFSHGFLYLIIKKYDYTFTVRLDFGLKSSVDIVVKVGDWEDHLPEDKPNVQASSLWEIPPRERAPLREVLEVVAHPGEYDLMFSNCKHYCERVLCHYLGCPPREFYKLI